MLLDEREGRHAAQRLGLRTIGVIGVLLEAKQHQHVKAVRPLLDSLRNTAGFYVSEPLYLRVLELAQEASSS